MNRLDGLTLNAHTLDDYLKGVAEPIDVVRNGRDAVMARVGKDLYDKLFKGYTRKQSRLDPSELVARVTARVPTRANRDDRYFTDTYQAMPLHGGGAPDDPFDAGHLAREPGRRVRGG